MAPEWGRTGRGCGRRERGGQGPPPASVSCPRSAGARPSLQSALTLAWPREWLLAAFLKFPIQNEFCGKLNRGVEHLQACLGLRWGRWVYDGECGGLLPSIVVGLCISLDLSHLMGAPENCAHRRSLLATHCPIAALPLTAGRSRGGYIYIYAHYRHLPGRGYPVQRSRYAGQPAISPRATEVLSGSGPAGIEGVCGSLADGHHYSHSLGGKP